MLRYHEIVTLNDMRYDDWLDLYQESFPLTEQMKVSALNRLVRKKAHGQAPDEHLFAAIDADEKTAAILHYEVIPQCRTTVLWYLAVSPEQRGQGLGAAIYAEVCRRAQARGDSLTFEVEDPDHTDTEELRAFAERRIRFYQRGGAKLLTGIHYTQSVGWQPRIAMHLMIHPFEDMDAQQAFELARCAFGEDVKQVGALELKSS